jgi:recombination protein RecA
MAAAPDIQALLERLGSAIKLPVAHGDARGRALSLWPELDAVLPDGGLPRGIVELSAPHAIGGSTSVSLAAVRSGQARTGSAWCAWLDPEGTLHAPGVVAAGVELARMLVVRCPREELGFVAVKIVSSGAFEVVVIDFDMVPRAGGNDTSPSRFGPRSSTGKKKRWGPEVLVRKLALVAEPNGTTVLLLTNASKPRATPWPVALRLELSRPNPRDLVVRVAKDKGGRIGLGRTIPFRLALNAV